jgi:Mrp family chromosome partitioning ATPase
MSKAIYVVGGSKGGVGKSLVSMALVHNLTQRGEEVFVIDADTSNPTFSNHTKTKWSANS